MERILFAMSGARASELAKSLKMKSGSSTTSAQHWAMDEDGDDGELSERSTGGATGVSASGSSGSGGSVGDTSIDGELARLVAEGDARLEGSETPPGLPPSMAQQQQRRQQQPQRTPPLPSPPPTLGGGSFDAPTSGGTIGAPSSVSGGGSSSTNRTEMLLAKKQRVEVLSALQQQYSVVEENVARLELRCAAAEEEALSQKEAAAARLDAQVSSEAAAEELRAEVTSMHEALLRSEKALATSKEATAVEAERASARALQEIATQRTQLEGALAGYEASEAGKARAEAATARASAGAVAAEGATEALAAELAELRAADTASQQGRQSFLGQLAQTLGGSALDGSFRLSEEALLQQVCEVVADSGASAVEAAACRALWERESAALTEKWELASVGMLSRISTMSQRVGRGERMQTRLVVAAEVLATSSRKPEPEPEPEPELEPPSRTESSPDRTPQLQAALDESTAAGRLLEKKTNSLTAELEETRRAFHKLHEKYGRTKGLLAQEKELRRELRRNGGGRRREVVHYVVDGMPPGEPRSGGEGETRELRRRHAPADRPGAGNGNDAGEEQPRQRSPTCRSPSVGSYSGRGSDVEPEEVDIGPGGSDVPAAYGGRPGSGYGSDRRYQERELCRGDYTTRR